MIVAILGQSLMLLALCAAVAGSGMSLAGRSSTTWQWRGRQAGRVLFAASLAGSLLLVLALLAGDFALSYVAERTNRDLSAGFRATALWSGQEGSLLLWLTMLSGFGVLMVRSARKKGAPEDLVSAANGVLLGIAGFFALLVAVVARPFGLADTLARDGAGMSPALQNYWMAIHPPALYVGYVAIAVPFSIVMGALVVRRRDDAWVAMTRRWSLVAWLGLTAGLLLGARWAYEEIGWGGYWAWDPVENAALMPWLTITAFLHSVQVQERRGMMRFWNVVLVTLTFGLSIFGTFLTRSGVLSSVHSFVSSPVGWWFMGFLAVSVTASLVLLYRTRDVLRARHDVETPVSREATFLFNNLLLVAMALTVLWGVLYPILSAGFVGERVALQAPWFEFFTIAFGLPLLALMAVGPSVPWRRGSVAGTWSRIRLPLALSIALGAVLMALGYGTSIPGVAGASFGAFVTLGIVGEVVRAVRARQAAATGIGYRRALTQVVAGNQRRYGGYIAHAGIGLLVIGIAGSSAYDSSTAGKLEPGEQLEHAGWTLRYTGLDRERTPNSMQTRGHFELLRGGDLRAKIDAGRNFYPASGEISNEVGIHHDLRTGSDLMVIVDQLTEDGTTRVKVVSNPLVNLLWAAGGLVALGGLVAAVPIRRGRRGGPTGPLREEDAPGRSTDRAPDGLGKSARPQAPERVHL